jgi:hypothetical protein
VVGHAVVEAVVAVEALLVLRERWPSAETWGASLMVALP